MFVQNKALQIFRQGYYHDVKNPIRQPTTKCQQLSKALTSCLKSNKLNILDGQGIRAKCDVVGQWRTNCFPEVRREFVQNTYKRQRNQDLYTQSALDKYMKVKNSHWNWQVFGPSQ